MIDEGIDEGSGMEFESESCLVSYSLIETLHAAIYVVIAVSSDNPLFIHDWIDQVHACCIISGRMLCSFHFVGDLPTK